MSQPKKARRPTGSGTVSGAREDRRRQVWQLRRAGASHAEISRALNIALGTVGNDLKIVGEAIRAETLAEAKAAQALEVARLDAIQKSAWPLAMGSPERKTEKGKVIPAQPPDVGAINSVRQIVETRAKLRGLYEPAVQDLQAQAEYMAESFARAVEAELGPEGKGLVLRVMAKWQAILDAEGVKNGLA